MELFENVTSHGSLGVALHSMISVSPHVTLIQRWVLEVSPAWTGPEPPALFPLCWEQHSWEGTRVFVPLWFLVTWPLTPVCPLELQSYGSCPTLDPAWVWRETKRSQHQPAVRLGLCKWAMGQTHCPCWEQGSSCLVGAGHCPYDEALGGPLRGWCYSLAQRHWWYLFIEQQQCNPKKPMSCKVLLGNPGRVTWIWRWQPAVSCCLLQSTRAPGCPQGERPV